MTAPCTRAGWAAALALLCACTTDESNAPPTPAACPEPAVALPDGSCLRPGVPVDGCGDGFVHDGVYGCDPILPPDPCPWGTMAVPGDAACREITPCAAGTWGDIPVDAETEHVDGAYGGGSSDGGSERPWTSIGAAVDAAAPGAIVAIAAGTYPEDLLLEGKAVRLWGVCPALVAVAGAGGASVTLALRDVVGAEVRGLALTGVGVGVGVERSQDVVLDRLWIHDTQGRGLTVEGAPGVTSVTLSGSLVEQARDLGVFVTGTGIVVDGTVVRDTQPRVNGLTHGRGISIQPPCDVGGCDGSALPDATIRGSLVERNYELGIYVGGGRATIERTVVRATQPEQFDLDAGRGLGAEICSEAEGCAPATPVEITVLGSLFDQNGDVGIWLVGADATIADTVVRHTQPAANDQRGGRGINVQACGPEAGCASWVRSAVVVSTSVIADNREHGLYASGSDVTIRDTVIRGTLPRASDQRMGRGLNVQLACPSAGCDPTAPGSAAIEASLLDANQDIGLFLAESVATLTGSVIRATSARASDGLFGDGVALFGELAPASLAVVGSSIEQSARAGLSSFGGSVSLETSRVRCAAFDLAREPSSAGDGTLEDRGGNLCGCPTADGPCQAVTASIDPPAPLTDGD